MIGWFGSKSWQLYRIGFPFPEDGLFYPDVVAGGFVVGDGVIGSIGALPSLVTVFAITVSGDPDVSPGRCFGGLSHSTK